MSRMDFYNSLTKFLVGPWWMYFLLGLNFVGLAVLILIYPQFLAYLIAAFLMVNGVIFLALAIRSWRLKHHYRYWRAQHRIHVN